MGMSSPMNWDHSNEDDKLRQLRLKSHNIEKINDCSMDMMDISNRELLSLIKDTNTVQENQPSMGELEDGETDTEDVLVYPKDLTAVLDDSRQDIVKEQLLNDEDEEDRLYAELARRRRRKRTRRRRRRYQRRQRWRHRRRWRWG